MTLPDERYRAVEQTQRFLESLLDSQQTPRVPKKIRDSARTLLRHYPSRWDLDRAAAASPDVFIRRLDPLYKMVKTHDMQQRMAEDVEEDLREAKNRGEL